VLDRLKLWEDAALAALRHPAVLRLATLAVVVAGAVKVSIPDTSRWHPWLSFVIALGAALGIGSSIPPRA